MAKKRTQSKASSATDVTQGFPASQSIEAFQRDVVVLFVQQMRTMAWMTGAELKYHSTLWQLVGKTPAYAHDIYFPDHTIEVLGVTWDDMRDTDFAKYLYSMYEFGCLGIIDTSLEVMEDESAYTWLSAILFDMKNSAFLNEWSGGYSGEGAESAKRCYGIAELANARRVLESGSPFSPLLSAHGVNEQGIDDDQLTVRQLALLAGMEEMSIRAAANPNRANPLPTIDAERQEKRTRFAADVAKTWLQSKGRYVPIVRQHKGGDIDLLTRRFQRIDELAQVIDDRLSYLSCGVASTPEVTEQAAELHRQYGITELDRRALSESGFVSALATILQFPPELFALRVRETVARDELACVERELRDASQLNS
jgi:hypothetical protein